MSLETTEEYPYQIPKPYKVRTPPALLLLLKGFFIEVLIKLLNNPTLMQTMGEYGRDKVKDKFSKNRLVKDIEALYEHGVSI